MKIAVLLTGATPPELAPRFGAYPRMFERLLAAPGAPPLHVFDVRQGERPDRPADFDGYLITGSSAGVYDELPWIQPLTDFLREARGQAALVGICFGHQIMAQAFGGKVIRSPKGWGFGLHRYSIAERQAWMDPGGDFVAEPASHQDQVVVPPPGARVTVASDFTPYAGLVYGDHRAISFQFHPEFEPAYAAALIERRRGSVHSDAEADAAIASLARPNDRLRVAGWIRRFLDGRSPTP